VRAAVLAAARAKKAAKDALGLRAGELEIATVLSVAVGILPASIAAWHRRFPNVAIGLREFRHRLSLERAVSSGVGDVAIGPRPDDWPGQVVGLGYEEFVLVLASNDPLAASETAIPLSAVAHHEWVLFEADHGLNELVNVACAQAGFVPSGSIRTSQVEAAARLAAAGSGVALVPGNIVPAGLDAGVLRLNPPLLLEHAAYARNEFSPQARSFVDTLVETTAKLTHIATDPPADAWLTNGTRVT
jgi:DNA-binding transcriptional LysR family regulator